MSVLGQARYIARHTGREDVLATVGLKQIRSGNEAGDRELLSTTKNLGFEPAVLSLNPLDHLWSIDLRSRLFVEYICNLYGPPLATVYWRRYEKKKLFLIVCKPVVTI